MPATIDRGPASRQRPPEEDQPVYWFVLLERALDAGDFDAAARATKELKRLGVVVTYRRRKGASRAS